MALVVGKKPTGETLDYSGGVTNSAEATISTTCSAALPATTR
jgi:hypothetical protein